jgi:hypothetical protein
VGFEPWLREEETEFSRERLTSLGTQVSQSHCPLSLSLSLSLSGVALRFIVASPASPHPVMTPGLGLPACWASFT